MAEEDTRGYKDFGKCSACGKIFKSIQGFKSHNKSKHQGKAKFTKLKLVPVEEGGEGGEDENGEDENGEDETPEEKRERPPWGKTGEKETKINFSPASQMLLPELKERTGKKYSEIVDRALIEYGKRRGVKPAMIQDSKGRKKMVLTGLGSSSSDLDKSLNQLEKIYEMIESKMGGKSEMNADTIKALGEFVKKDNPLDTMKALKDLMDLAGSGDSGTSKSRMIEWAMDLYKMQQMQKILGLGNNPNKSQNQMMNPAMQGMQMYMMKEIMNPSQRKEKSFSDQLQAFAQMQKLFQKEDSMEKMTKLAKLMKEMSGTPSEKLMSRIDEIRSKMEEKDRKLFKKDVEGKIGQMWEKVKNKLDKVEEGKTTKSEIMETMELVREIGEMTGNIEPKEKSKTAELKELAKIIAPTVKEGFKTFRERQSRRLSPRQRAKVKEITEKPKTPEGPGKKPETPPEEIETW